jgi:hypothetical protein
MRATMTAAATATIATVETARSIIPLSSRRLLVRPYNAPRIHARALRPRAPAHLGALLPRACALPAYVCAHAPACSGRSCPGPWIATACGRNYRRSLACPLHPLMAPSWLCPRSRSSTPPAPTRQVSCAKRSSPRRLRSTRKREGGIPLRSLGKELATALFAAASGRASAPRPRARRGASGCRCQEQSASLLRAETTLAGRLNLRSHVKGNVSRQEILLH